MVTKCLHQPLRSHPQYTERQRKPVVLTRIRSIIHVDVHAVSVGWLALQLLLLLLDLVFTLAINVDTTVLGHLIVLTCVRTIGSGDAGHSGVFTSSRRLAIGSSNSSSFLAIVLGLVGTVILVIRSEIGLGLLRGEFGRSCRIVVPGRVEESRQMMSTKNQRNKRGAVHTT